ncbi:MAG: AAA family ATPase [Bacteroidales bacterium]|nr:AAA family ATPase [Bacteroidales bacterium]
MKPRPQSMTIEYVGTRAYISDEWFNSKKKYRTVFERHEIDKINIEIELFNLLYQKEEQNIYVRISLIEMVNNQEEVIGKVEYKQEIGKEDKFIYLRHRIEEIGVMRTHIPEKKCEVYVNDKLEGTLLFYINDVGQLTHKYNPYFDIVEIRLFNGNEIDDINKITPLKVFKRDAIQYMYVDLVVKNKVSQLCYLEFSYRYMDKNGFIKGEAGIIEKLTPQNGEIVHFYTGWGRSEASSEIYPQDIYFVDILLLGQIIARVQAVIADEEIVGNAFYWLGNPFIIFASSVLPKAGRISMKDDVSVQPVLDKLNSMIGLNELKSQINELLAFIKYLNLEKKMGIVRNETLNLHTVLMGNSGVGKSSIVKLLGEIFAAMGLLSNGQVIEVSRSDLVAEYIGQTAPQTRKFIEKARGGILFVKEAHDLYRGPYSNDYGIEAIEVLIHEMMDGSGDIVIVFGGYKDEMENFLSSNRALKSCFGYYFTIPDYTPDQLMQILIRKANELNLIISNEAQVEFEKIILNKYRDRDKTFGNARFAINLLQDARMNMAKRIMNDPHLEELNAEKLSTIEKIDVLEIINNQRFNEKLYLRIDEPMLELALTELNNLVGLQKVKKEINELVKLTRFYNERGKPFHKALSLHYVFAGNPGTGKTTVARLLGNIFRALGVLEKGHLVEVDRSELVAGYIGQTAIKTEELIHSAINGILFIDEAYSLTSSSENDFGKEAIEVLVKEMEDHRNELSIIVAGYPDLMNKFIHSNPGLKSRFTRVLYFDDYSEQELVEIAKIMLKEEDLIMTQEAEQSLLLLIREIPRGKSFGNARDVRKIVDLIIKKHNLRVAEIPVSHRTEEDVYHVREIDIPFIEEISL